MDRQSWSDIAEWYDQLIRAGSGPHQLAVETTLRLVPRLSGLDVLDVACGQGLLSRALVCAGAQSVTAVDFTPEMIAIAKRYEDAEPLGIDYRVDNAEVLSSVDDQSVDVVTCQLGLMDIPDAAAAVKSVARVLRVDRSFVFVIGHPCFLAPEVATLEHENRLGRLVCDYLTERFWHSTNPHGVRRVGNYHRTLSNYLNLLATNRLSLVDTLEPAANELLAIQQPVYRTVPIFFAGRATKSSR